MPVRVARAVTARETATAVPRLERAPERQRNRAGLAAHAQRLAVWSFEDGHEPSIAREPAHGIERQRRTVLELTAMRFAVVRDCAALRQHCSVDVNDDLVPIVHRTERIRLML